MTEAPRPRESRRKRREPKPLEVRLTVCVNFSDADEDRITVIDDRKIWMVGSIFQYRDKIARMAMATVVRAALLQPRVAAKIMPGLGAVAARASRRARH